MMENNQARIDNYVTKYTISPVLLMDNIVEPTIDAKYITKGVSGLFDDLNNEGTHVGYKVEFYYDRSGLIDNRLNPQKINLYVYNSSGKKVKFYVKNCCKKFRFN